MITFDILKDEHLDEILKIYNYYVLNSTATFSIVPLTKEEMSGIVYSGHKRFKSFVILQNNELIGYVLLSRYKPREAYDNTAEVTVYLKPNYVGRSVGTTALEFIESIAIDLKFKALLAVICEENKASIRLFEKSKYFKCAHLREVGVKFGRVLDVVIYEKLL